MQWLDPNRPICENCLLEAKRRAAEDIPKKPLRFTAANYADPGDTLPETDALTFFEEEILSPIQHIVRIFTLHTTGQCELRGHVGNLFQNGPQYVRNIPAAIGDMKMLLIRLKDPNRKQRIPFIVSRRRLERALDRVFKPLSEGGSQAMQPGAVTTGGFVEFVNRDNLEQFANNEEGEEPPGLQVQVVEQIPWERIERKLFAMWVSCNWNFRWQQRCDCCTKRRRMQKTRPKAWVCLCGLPKQAGMLRTALVYVFADCRTSPACHGKRRYVFADCRTNGVCYGR